MSASFRRVPCRGLEEDQFHLLVDKVALVIIFSIKGRWVWILDSGVEFSVKSARSYIDDYLFSIVGPPTRWVNVIPIKINIFAWRISLDRLPSRFNLSFRGIDLPTILDPICSSARETSSHLLFSCNVARQLLFKVSRWWELDIQDFHSYVDWLSWFNGLRLSKGHKFVLEGVFYVTWWVIWKFHNQVIFGSSHPRLDLLFDEIVLMTYTWCSSRCKNNFDWISWMKCPSSLCL
nr:RNA-directed DNA polymerase, eukaryota [Tanacetum cinerariifolium]